MFTTVAILGVVTLVLACTLSLVLSLVALFRPGARAM